MLHSSDSNGLNELTTPPTHAEPQQLDVVKTLWRWKWLPILGALIGALVGFLNFTREQPIYESFALIQVVYPNAEAVDLEPINGADTVRGQSRLDESRIIMSETVIEKAITLSKLKEHPKLSSMSEAQLRSWIKSPNLSVQPAGRDSSTALIEIRFKSTDGAVSQLVVDAMIDGYDHYLTEAYRKLGNEVVGVVTKTQDQLRKSYEEIAKKNAEFRQNAPLVWLGEEGTNHFAENCMEIKKSINEIEIEGLRLQSLLKHVQTIEKQGRAPESILQMLTSDAQLNNILFQKEEPVQEKSTEKPLPYSTADRRGALIDLQIKEQELLNSVGEGHPAVASTRLRIELLTKQIEAMSQEEVSAPPKANSEVTDPMQKLVWWKSAIQDRMAALHVQRTSLQSLSDEYERKSKELGQYISQNNLLNKELASAQALLDNYTNTLNRIQILPQGRQLTLQTLTPPANGQYVSPTLPPFLMGGAAVGALLLAGLALAIDFADRGFRSPDEITRDLGLPVLGHVPQLITKKSKSDSNRQSSALKSNDELLCALGKKNTFGIEAFRSIRTALYFRETVSDNRILQVTSPVPGDGKSTVAANLAISIAQSGRSVLLIDADMRRPRISKLFGIQPQGGLPEVLRGEAKLTDVVIDGPLPGLSLIASSKPAHDPAELLSTGALATFLASIREQFDYIVLDTPPLLAVSDPCSIAARADAVLLTVRLRRNARPLAQQAMQALDQLGIRPIGIVVNGITNSRSYDYRYGQYGYQETVEV